MWETLIVEGMPWPKTGTNQCHTKLGLPGNGRMVLRQKVIFDSVDVRVTWTAASSV